MRLGGNGLNVKKCLLQFQLENVENEQKNEIILPGESLNGCNAQEYQR